MLGAMAQVLQTFGPAAWENCRVEWSETGPVLEPVSEPFSGYLIPGFVDVHIHGGFGVDFMSATREDLDHWLIRLRAAGYEALLPTTVTASPEAVLAAVERLPDDPMIQGFHLEGPFISPKFPGAQPPEFILDPPLAPGPWDAVLDHPHLRYITLAPERPHALELILRLQRRGVVVSMGHTDATFEEARRGFEFGATHTTHTYNAMRGLHHREAGTVGYALVNPALNTELIYDRIHVCPDAARVLINAKPIEALIGISDATMVAGTPPNRRATMWGLDVTVGRGEVRLVENNALAGSAVTLDEVFRNLATDFGPQIAVYACCLNPRRILGMVGAPRVWLELDRDFRLVRRREIAP